MKRDPHPTIRKIASHIEDVPAEEIHRRAALYRSAPPNQGGRRTSCDDSRAEYISLTFAQITE
jgi:hypothetical protein